MAELYYDEEVCYVKEERGPWVEEFAIRRGHTHFYYDMHCIETMMNKYFTFNVPSKNEKIFDNPTKFYYILT